MRTRICRAGGNSPLKPVFHRILSRRLICERELERILWMLRNSLVCTALALRSLTYESYFKFIGLVLIQRGPPRKKVTLNEPALAVMARDLRLRHSEFSVLRTRSYYQDLGQKFDGWVCIYLCGSSRSEFEKNGKRSFFLVLRICAYHFNPVLTKTGGGRKER